MKTFFEKSAKTNPLFLALMTFMLYVVAMPNIQYFILNIGHVWISIKNKSLCFISLMTEIYFSKRIVPKLKSFFLKKTIDLS
jgi:hypothetical protein